MGGPAEIKKASSTASGEDLPLQNEIMNALPCSSDVLLKNLHAFGDASVIGLDWGCWKDH